MSGHGHRAVEPTAAGRQHARASLRRPSIGVYVASSHPPVVSVLRLSGRLLCGARLFLFSMGCDITPHIARRTGDGKLEPFMYSAIDLARDYVLFGLLAGVRGKVTLFEPRGLPADVPFTYKFDFERMDAHTPSWLTTEEVREVAEAYPSASAEQGGDGGMNPFLAVLVGLMEAFDAWAVDYDPGGSAVLIFWFDS